MKNKDIPLPLNDVIIHESAHAIIAFLYDYTIDKICIYPVSGSDPDGHPKSPTNGHLKIPHLALTNGSNRYSTS